MDSEIQRVYDRITLYYLMQDHPDWKSERYTEHIDRTASWVRKWRARIQQEETITLQTFLSQSRAPKSRPNQTSKHVKKIIGDLREELSEDYHRPAGANLILLELNAQDELFDNGYFVPSSPSTIHEILKEMGYVQPPKKTDREPITRPDPNVEWEMDFGEIRLDETTKLEFFLVVDRGTSRVIYLEGSMGYNAQTALSAVARLLTKCGCPKYLRFDRDTRFVGSWTGDSYPSALIRFLRVVGVKPVVCPPRRPDLKPFVERCIQTLKYEWLDRHSVDSYADGVEALSTFKTYHNEERIHLGRACNGRIPDEKFSNLPPLPAVPERVDPNAWMAAYDHRVFRRRITANGTIQIDKYTYYIDKAWAKTKVLVYLDAQRCQFKVVCENEDIAVLDMKGMAYEDELDFEDYLNRMKEEALSIEMHHYHMQMPIGDIA